MKAAVKEKLDHLGQLGDTLVAGFQMMALFVIGATTVWSAASDYVGMIGHGRAGLEDILLLFIYLELGTMVGIYFKTDRLPGAAAYYTTGGEPLRGSSPPKVRTQYAGQGIREHALLKRLAQDCADSSDSGALGQIVSAMPGH
jgi:hypothetical protein